MTKLLITTIKRGYPVEDSGAAYIVDWDKRKVLHRTGMLPLNARIPRNPRGGIRGLRGACVKDNKIFIASNDTISVLNAKLELEGTISNRFFSNLHDLRVYDGDMYVASCGIDSIINVYTGLVHNPPPENMLLRYDNVDRHGTKRLNSIAFYKGRKIVSFAGDNKILIENGCGNWETLVRDAGRPHSLTTVGNVLYFTSAVRSEVLTLTIPDTDLFPMFPVYRVFTDKKPWWLINTRMTRWGWLRGLAVKNNALWVGSSPHARILWINRLGRLLGTMKLSRIKSETVSDIILLPETLC